MNITEWAKNQNMTPEEFILEITSTMAAIGVTELEKKSDGSDAVVWNVDDQGNQVQVIVRKL